MIIYFLVGLFFVGIIAFVYTFSVNAHDWAMSRSNRHIYTNGQLSSAGVIYDCKNTVLAKTVKGKRVYNDSETVREAVLHTVGDTTGYISTGIQAEYQSELTGYNIFNGVYMLKKYDQGNNIHLTVNAEACASVLKALDGRKGAVCVYNYKTGEIICMVSSPTYDPYDMPKDIFTNKTDKYDGIFLNRVVSGVYTPGSIFKVITASAAVENIPDIYTQTFNCKGKMTVEGGTIICNGVHGELNFTKAFEKSCNIAFSQIAIQLGKDKMTQQANAMGFNKKFYMGRTPIATSTFNLSNSDKLDVGWAGVGQSTTLVSPYLMMTIMGAIANGGTPVMPYVVSSITTPSGIPIEKNSGQNGTQMLSSEAARKVGNLMRNNVKNSYGDWRFDGLNVCAKTGTAEVGSGKKPNAWFVGFTQDDDCPLAFAVVLDNGDSGIRIAAPVASSALKACSKAVRNK